MSGDLGCSYTANHNFWGFRNSKKPFPPKYTPGFNMFSALLALGLQILIIALVSFYPQIK